ncbi:MAG TPA: serine hydroxymethyltransferase [Fibrobacteria bacterium]|nr:serine hydroxymethyltransferase [Fibrobacteria bacterium]
MSILQSQDPEIHLATLHEELRQIHGLELIASENYVSPAVLDAMSSVFTNKYSEGYPGKRYYGGQEYVDVVETLAIERAKALFGAKFANVQPLSGSPANLAVYFALLNPGDTVLGLALDHGGHLSHGHPVNASGILYKFTQYTVDKSTGRIDMNQVREIARREKPKLILAGFSAYSRDLDWKEFKSIADEVGAYTMADIAHIAGLVAGKAIESPVGIFDVVTTTTHKTLRGPRGALILTNSEDLAKKFDRAVFPGMQGGPHVPQIAAKAVAFGEALRPSFQVYAKNVIQNAQRLSTKLQEKGFAVISGGTDNHLMVVDMTSKGLSGKESERLFDEVGISSSRSTIPYDPRKPLDPSGVRLGSAAVTTRGFGLEQMDFIADILDRAVAHRADASKLASLKAEVSALASRYPLFRMG